MNEDYVKFWQRLVNLTEELVIAENTKQMAKIAELETKIQDMLMSKLATEVEYKTEDGLTYVDGKARATAKARTQSLLALQAIRNAADKTFDLGKQGYTYISSVEPKTYAEIAERAIEDWKKIIGRLNDPSIYTAEQIEEAKILLENTKNIAKKYKGYDNFTKRNKEAATFGRFSNIHAMLNDSTRLYAEGIVGNTLATGSPHKKKMLDFVKSKLINRNVAYLSFTAHLRALYISSVVDFGKAVGITSFLCLIPKQAQINPSGIQAQHVGKIRTVNQWNAIFDTLNKGRKSKQSFPGLGLHHGSCEYYVPVPDYLME